MALLHSKIDAVQRQLLVVLRLTKRNSYVLDAFLKDHALQEVRAQVEVPRSTGEQGVIISNEIKLKVRNLKYTRQRGPQKLRMEAASMVSCETSEMVEWIQRSNWGDSECTTGLSCLIQVNLLRHRLLHLFGPFGSDPGDRSRAQLKDDGLYSRGVPSSELLSHCNFSINESCQST